MDVKDQKKGTVCVRSFLFIVYVFLVLRYFHDGCISQQQKNFFFFSFLLQTFGAANNNDILY